MACTQEEVLPNEIAEVEMIFPAEEEQQNEEIEIDIPKEEVDPLQVNEITPD